MTEGFKDIWWVLKSILGYAIVLLVMMPLLLVSELVCIPECLTAWLWKVTIRLISLPAPEEG